MSDDCIAPKVNTVRLICHGAQTHRIRCVWSLLLEKQPAKTQNVPTYEGTIEVFMEMFTVRDLRNRTGKIIREAELGHSKEAQMKIQDLTDYERLKKMTEKELEEAVKSDPDVPHLSEEDLKKFQRVERSRSSKNEKVRIISDEDIA
jgi:hypothetical protein